jgi:hypothetical protein
VLQAGRSRVPFPMKSLDFLIDLILPAALWPLREVSTRNIPGDKGWPARKAENLTAICESAVWIMWEPRRLTNLRVSTTCYRDTFIVGLKYFESES